MAYRQRMRLDQIALQLYTVRALAADDLAGTLARRCRGRLSIASSSPGFPRRAQPSSPGCSTRPACGRSRRTSRSSELRRDWERGRGSSGRHRLPPGRSCRGSPRRIAARSTALRGFAAELGGFAGTLGDRGIRLAYHNHEFEFAPLDGTTVWDVLLAELPAEVELEIDVYWACGRRP